jgi:anti-sigma factor RsiW
MNPQEIFDAWKAQKSQDDVSRQFTDRVMAVVQRREARRDAGPALLRGIATRPWARAAALIVGALLGLARIIATLHLILFA